MNNEEMKIQSERMLGLINDSNAADEKYRRRRAERALELLNPKPTPENPNPKKPTELVLNAMLDSDAELCELREIRNKANAQAQVSKMAFESWSKDVPANGPGPLLG